MVDEARGTEVSGGLAYAWLGEIYVQIRNENTQLATTLPSEFGRVGTSLNELGRVGEHKLQSSLTAYIFFILHRLGWVGVWF